MPVQPLDFVFHARPSEEKQNPWRCSVPFFRAWEEAKNTVHTVGVQLRLVELWLYPGKLT